MNHSLENTTLHFDLSFMEQSTPVRLHVGAKKIDLKCHNTETIKKHSANNAALSLIPEKNITHYAEDVEVPKKYAQLLLLKTDSKIPDAKLDTLLLSMLHVPRKARVENAKRLVNTNHPNAFKNHPKFGMYGKEVTIMRDLSPTIDVHNLKTAQDAATSIVFHHQELVNIDFTTSATVHNIIEYSNGISDLTRKILDQATSHQKNSNNQNWAFQTPYLDKDFKPTSTNYYNWSDITKEAMRGPMLDSIKLAKNEPSLKSTTTNAGVYTVQDGITNVTVPQNSSIDANSQFEVESSDNYWTLNNLTPGHGFVQSSGVSLIDNIFSISFTNEWLRWLSGYVEFYGPDGTPVKPEGWTSQVPGALAGTYDSDTKKYVAIFSSVNTILAIPVGNTPTEIKFPWPSNASSVKILAGGIGRTGGVQGQDGKYYGSWDPQVCTAGAVMTGIFNFGIPTACILFGAPVSLSGLNQIASSAIAIILDVASTLITGIASSAIQGGNTTTLMVAFADMIPKLLLDITELAAWMTAEIAVGAAEEATPIFGWIALAVSVASDVALLVETSVEVGLSPATFELSATRAIDATWTLLPDADHQNTWPLEATHYEVLATYKDGTTRSSIGKLQSSPQTGPITVNFSNANANRLPAGGQVMFRANFYSDTGWLAGGVRTKFMSADIPSNLLTVPKMNIKENLVPLTSSTLYSFDQKLIYNAQTNTREWSKTGGAPTATVKDLSGSDIGNNLNKLVNITISQQTSELGYTWEASGQNIPLAGQTVPNHGQIYTFQGIDDRSNPESGLKFVPNGFPPKPLLLFDIDGPASGTGFNFWVDPRSGLYNIRQVLLDGNNNPFDISVGKSWGRFNEQIDAAVIHPSGYIVGISTNNSKIEILKLGTAAVDDVDAPMANIYSGYGTRPGLVHIPTGVAATPNAGFIVLEAADSRLQGAGARLQSFDLLGNPAPIFKGQSAVAPLQPENAPVTVLDIAVETKGFIYVLKYLNEGDSVDDYRLDLYSPDGSWLSQTAGISAAKLDVDIWRTLYSLNFEIMEKPDGKRTEPSVSIWLPSTPKQS